MCYVRDFYADLLVVFSAVTVMLSRGKDPVWSFNEIEALKNRIYCYNRRQPDCDLISSGYFVALFRHPARQTFVSFHLAISSSGYFVIRPPDSSHLAISSTK